MGKECFADNGVHTIGAEKKVKLVVLTEMRGYSDGFRGIRVGYRNNSGVRVKSAAVFSCYCYQTLVEMVSNSTFINRRMLR
jgi:hypothetical protein